MVTKKIAQYRTFRHLQNDYLSAFIFVNADIQSIFYYSISEFNFHLQLHDILDGLLGVSLRLLHVAALHAVHDGDQVDQDTQLVARQPEELLRGRAADQVPLTGPVRWCHRLDTSLENHRLQISFTYLHRIRQMGQHLEPYLKFVSIVAVHENVIKISC